MKRTLIIIGKTALVIVALSLASGVYSVGKEAFPAGSWPRYIIAGVCVGFFILFLATYIRKDEANQKIKSLPWPWRAAMVFGPILIIIIIYIAMGVQRHATSRRATAPVTRHRARTATYPSTLPEARAYLRARAINAGIDPDGPYWDNVCRLAPQTDADGNPLTFDQQIDWAISHTRELLRTTGRTTR